ncbi:MAG TPA: hypothetical protein VLL08_03825 [Kineosporiaceae bacterium]|nr:hypothetical protein [Kineosporiaceae bacterium]
MGLIKDLFALNRQAKEINRNYDPGAQTRKGLEMMQQLNQTLATQTQAQKLTQTGVAAAGSIIGLTDTGTRINGAPVVRLGLLVEVGGRPPYPVYTELVLPVEASAQAGVGQRVALMIDPENHDNVLVRWGQLVI